MTLSTSSAVLEVLSAWHLWVWCSLTTCCRTWREASRPRSCGSASPWRWQPSPPENVPGLGLGFEEPHPAPTQSPELLLPWHWAGHIHAVWFCQGPCSLLCGLTHKHSTQAVQSAPTPSTYRDFLFLCVCLSTQSSEEKPGQLPALLHSGKTPCSRSIMVHVCNCGIKVYSFLFSSISALPFPPKMKTLTEIYHPPPSLHVQCFVVLFSSILNETTGCGSFSCCNIPFQSGRCCEASFAKSLSLWIWIFAEGEERAKSCNMRNYIVTMGEDFSVFSLIFFWYFV